ncbi:hypothetical protein VTO42DRAFT_1538 [Malbranchea cinnamomea]
MNMTSRKGRSSSHRVLARAGQKRAYTTAPDSKEWVTVIEAVSAEGQHIRPLVIFKGQAPQSSWIDGEEVPDWHYTTSENGWTSNEIAINWLRHVFLPEAATESDSHRMLILDGHASHTSIDFLWICKENNVHTVFLPPHSSHVLQPLDLSVFGPLKDYYRSRLADIASLDDGAPVKKRHFLQIYNQARTDTLTPRVIRGGWKAAGLAPWNPATGLNSSQLRIQQATRASTPPNNLTANALETIDPLLTGVLYGITAKIHRQ